MQEEIMDNWTFGITIIVLGMGGSTLVLLILSSIMSILKMIFPYEKEKKS
jgi:Na+-transporting methylmalonyl-CoA/oxaloacetate decarboxylase gamma subunit